MKRNIETNKYEPVRRGGRQRLRTKSKTAYMAYTALMTALIFIATLYINIPASFILGAGGNINLGDAFIYVSAYFLGPAGGFASALIGPALADIAGGYMIYAPATAVIKALCGLTAGYLFKRAAIKKNNDRTAGGGISKIAISGGDKIKAFLRRFVPMLAGSLIVITGYFLAECIIVAALGAAESAVILISAARTLIPNLIQCVMSCLIALTVTALIPENLKPELR